MRVAAFPLGVEWVFTLGTERDGSLLERAAQFPPEEVQFVNDVLEKGGVKDLIAEVYEICGQEVTTTVADAVKHIGFTYAMRSGITLAVSDIAVPAAMRLALPQANPGLYLSMSLGVTFPFNIILGIPLFAGLARAIG